MGKPRITLRLPENLKAAYDRADGNRSKLMRRVLAEAVVDGRVEGVPEDLRTLAAIDDAVDEGQLNRRRGTFRGRCAEFYKDKWRSGYITGSDAESMAESWRREATVYGAEYLAWVDAVVGWFSENWDAAARPNWPDPSAFHARADPDSVDVDDALVDTLKDAREKGLDRGIAVSRVSRYHPQGRVEAAAERAYGEKA